MSDPMSDDADLRPTGFAKLRREALEFARFVAGVVAVFLLITTFVFRSFYIPSSSMEPTLEVGDRVVTLTFVYGFSRFSLPFGIGAALPKGDCRIPCLKPKQGDVVVFRHPDPRRRDHLIKRVVGLPGDTIEIKGGRLYVNDVAAEREEIARVRYRHYERGSPVEATRYAETLPNGRRHPIYEQSDSHEYDNFPYAFRVPENHIFVMGDNRDSSEDSRAELEYVPVENLVGRAVTVLFTFKSCKKEPGFDCPSGRIWRPL